jgi:hypothetical protein
MIAEDSRLDSIESMSLMILRVEKMLHRLIDRFTNACASDLDCKRSKLSPGAVAELELHPWRAPPSAKADERLRNSQLS